VGDVGEHGSKEQSSSQAGKRWAKKEKEVENKKKTTSEGHREKEKARRCGTCLRGRTRGRKLELKNRESLLGKLYGKTGMAEEREGREVIHSEGTKGTLVCNSLLSLKAYLNNYQRGGMKEKKLGGRGD